MSKNNGKPKKRKILWRCRCSACLQGTVGQALRDPARTRARLARPDRSGIDDHLQRLVGGGTAEGLIGCHDVAELEAMRDQLRRIDFPGLNGLQQHRPWRPLRLRQPAGHRPLEPRAAGRDAAAADGRRRRRGRRAAGRGTGHRGDRRLPGLVRRSAAAGPARQARPGGDRLYYGDLGVDAAVGDVDCRGHIYGRNWNACANGFDDEQLPEQVYGLVSIDLCQVISPDVKRLSGVGRYTHLSPFG